MTGATTKRIDIDSIVEMVASRSDLTPYPDAYYDEREGMCYACALGLLGLHERVFTGDADYPYFEALLKELEEAGYDEWYLDSLEAGFMTRAGSEEPTAGDNDPRGYDDGESLWDSLVWHGLVDRKEE